MRAKGIDISHWQETFKYVGQIDFIIQKVTEGWSWTDPKFEEFLPEVKKVPIRGAYHYYLTSLDPVLQACHFHKTVKDHGYHFLAVDYEKANNNLNKAGAENLKKFWDKLQTLTDLPVLLYVSPYIYRDNLCAFDKFWETVPLWIAHWNGQDPETGEPNVFDGWGWVIWQYASDIVDKDVYNGPVEKMRKWLKLDTEEDMEVKKWYQSKTLWFFVLSLIVSVAGYFGFADFHPSAGQEELIGIIISVMGILLRAFTNKGVEL
jgi:hypothetical protein